MAAQFKAVDDKFIMLLGVPMFVLTLYTLLKGMIGF
jgi:hypothetical protein